MARTVIAPTQLVLLLPDPPRTVDGVPGQLDLVAAVLEAEVAAERAAAAGRAPMG